MKLKHKAFQIQRSKREEKHKNYLKTKMEKLMTREEPPHDS